MLDSDSKQFRRQLIATIAGAVIGISGSASIALFQWTTQSKERRTQERVEALSQFSASLSNQLGGQAAGWHLAMRCGIIAARAKRLAAKPDLNKQEVIMDYKALLKDTWILVSDIIGAYQEASKSNAALTSAYYKLLAVFPDVPPLEVTPLTEQLQLLGTMPEVPEGESLRQFATGYERWGTSFKSAAESLGKQTNTWNQRLLELGRKVRE